MPPQRLFRGSAARKRARKEREDEMVYIGMKPAESTLEELQRELDIAYQKRKQEQASWFSKSRNAQKVWYNNPLARK